MKTFTYQGRKVKFSKNGFNYMGNNFPYALLNDQGIEYYFHTKECAKKFIDYSLKLEYIEKRTK